MPTFSCKKFTQARTIAPPSKFLVKYKLKDGSVAESTDSNSNPSEGSELIFNPERADSIFESFIANYNHLYLLLKRSPNILIFRNVRFEAMDVHKLFFLHADRIFSFQFGSSYSLLSIYSISNIYKMFIQINPK